MNQLSLRLWLALFLFATFAPWNSLTGQTQVGQPSQTNSTTFSRTAFEQRLFDLPDVRFERIDQDSEMQVYLLHVKQSVNHQDKTKGHFHQRVKLMHRGFDHPMLMNTNGYGLEQRPIELVELLKSNYISVEHRFFGPSTPKNRDWKNLTIQQAAADYHHIRTILGQIYQQAWLSTGISKGGETCTYYKFFYPNDVVFSIPYVAPFPNAFKDQRIYKFLDTMGSEEGRKKIYTFQENVLKNMDKILPLFRYFLKGKKAKCDLIGGPQAALELFVLEYPFSFWQVGMKMESIPKANASHEELLDHLIDNGEFWYLLDKNIKVDAAHYYQHATQLGYYGYRAGRFGNLIKKWQGEPSACFFPELKDLKFDSKIRENLIKWLKTDAKNIVFLYGAMDTWTVAQADLGDNKNVRKYIFKGKHHGNARLKYVDKKFTKEILGLIRKQIQQHDK